MAHTPTSQELWFVAKWQMKCEVSIYLGKRKWKSKAFICSRSWKSNVSGLCRRLKRKAIWPNILIRGWSGCFWYLTCEWGLTSKDKKRLHVFGMRMSPIIFSVGKIYEYLNWILDVALVSRLDDRAQQPAHPFLRPELCVTWNPGVFCARYPVRMFFFHGIMLRVSFPFLWCFRKFWVKTRTRSAIIHTYK